MHRLHVQIIFDLVFIFEAFQLAIDVFKRRLYIPEFFDDFQHIKIDIIRMRSVYFYRCVFKYGANKRF